jgi:hypothetical protein
MICESVTVKPLDDAGTQEVAAKKEVENGLKIRGFMLSLIWSY